MYNTDNKSVQRGSLCCSLGFVLVVHQKACRLIKSIKAQCLSRKVKRHLSVCKSNMMFVFLLFGFSKLDRQTASFFRQLKLPLDCRLTFPFVTQLFFRVNTQRVVGDTHFPHSVMLFRLVLVHQASQKLSFFFFFFPPLGQKIESFHVGGRRSGHKANIL